MDKLSSSCINSILLISLHADPSMPPGAGEYGGGHMYPRELLLKLSNMNITVSLLVRKTYPSLPEVEKVNENCTVYRLNYGDIDPFDKQNLYVNRQKSLKLAEAVIERYHIAFQVIHSIYWNSGQLAWELSKLYHIPYVHSVISNGMQISLTKAKAIDSHRIETEKQVFQNASFIFCITDSEKEDLVKLYAIEASKIYVIGRLVPTPYKAPAHDTMGCPKIPSFSTSAAYLSLPPHANVYDDKEEDWWKRCAFTYVGRIHVNKGIDKIIQAWHSLYLLYQDNCPPLWMVGGTPDEIREFRSTLSLNLPEIEQKGKLIWWGNLDAEGISTIYLKTLVVIMHSRYEPGGRVSLEAMTAGIPVIGTFCGFAKDTIIDWKNGFLVEYGDIDALAHRMEHFVKQPFLSYCLGLGAKACAEEWEQRWDFLYSHLKAYCSAGNIPYTYKKPVVKTADDAYELVQEGYLHVYPYVNDRAEPLRVKYTLISAFIKEPFQIQCAPAKQHCFCWNITLPSRTSYLVMQPFSCIDYDYTRLGGRFVNTSNRLFALSQMGKEHLQTNIVYPDNMHQMLVCRNLIPISYSKELLPDAVGFLVQNMVPYSQVADSYGKYFDGMFFSLKKRFEQAELILHTDRTMAPYLEKMQKTIATMPEKEYVISGVIAPNTLGRDENQSLKLLNCQFLHPGDMEEDYAALLLLTMDTEQSPHDWSSLLTVIPPESLQLTILWSIVHILQKYIYLKERNIDFSFSDFIQEQFQFFFRLLA